MWHRGNQAKARDLFDLCAVADLEPGAIEIARPFMKQHGASFIARLRAYEDLSREEFNRIDRINYTRSFEECIDLAEKILALEV